MIIVLTGKMGVGKSTAVDCLKMMIPDNVKVVKFAGPLYEMQEFLYRRISSVYTRPDTFVKDRNLLQFLGTEWGRNTIDQNVWVDLWKADVTKALKAGYTVICDDCRFDNEAETAKALGATIIKITAETEDRKIAGKELGHHTSEHGINYTYIDEWVKNAGSLSDFQSKIEQVYKKILPAITLEKHGVGIYAK